MSSHENLYFFNKQGDALNFRYDDTTQLFQGDILFDENSNDTFKTFALYTLERIPSFEFESPGDLGTNKFQLFNEYGFHYYGCTNSFQQQITKIEPVNNDPDFYSKWIYGINFESKFPVGTLIVFNQNLLEFTNIKQTFVVVGTKKNAILIISTVDNSTFESTYYNDYTNNSLYSGKTISGIDAIGVYNYIDTNYVNNLSPWSEPNFYDKVYKGKKLNIINSKSNDGTYTIKGPEITDIIHFEYLVSQTVLPVDSNLIIEVVLGTDLPKLYDGSLNITGDNRILVNDYLYYPRVLRPGQEFKIVGSVLNENFLTVADIYDFESIYSVKYYQLDDQIYFKGKLYQCILSYTHSHADDTTKYLTPDTDTTHWSNPTYIKVNETTTVEPLFFSQLYLTKEKYYYDFGYTQSSAVTMASAAEKYKTDISIFNVDLYYDKGYLKADLVYPSRYAKVNFYHTQVGPTYSIGTEYKSFERLIEVNETLTTEFNYDYSENFKYNIVFTDLDEYGLKLIINKQVYEEEISYVYTGIGLDMSRTIDKTLRNWLTRNYLTLYKLGLDVELAYTYVPNLGLPINSLFFNSIVVKTEYPNVPVDISDVLVGTTANYFIEHSRVLFNTIGPTLNVNINNKDHIISGITSSTLSTSTYSVIDVPKTLQAWIDLYANDLLEYGFIVTNINSVLKFDVKQTDVAFNYTIKTGKVDLPGLSDYVITKKMKGNFGGLVTSNEVILSATSSYSFEQEGFATGMVFSINNTNWPLMNVEYNIQYLDPLVLNLSYEGPFWDYNNTICDKSPFVTIAFNLGFGQTGCGAISSTGMGGQFNQYQFEDTQFNIIFYPNTYQITDYASTTNLVDIKYIQLSNTILSYGDNLVVHDSYTGTFLIEIELVNNIDSIKMEYNSVNNYVYCLSKNIVWIVDPSTNLLLTSFSLSHDSVDLQINPINGDVYITYSNLSEVHIFYSNTFNGVYDVTIPSTFGRTGKMVFSEFEQDMYVVTVNRVLRVNGSNRTLQTSYSVPGVIDTIVYEPVNESIYVYGSSNLYKIDNGVVNNISVTTESFNDIIFNNLTGDMNISDSSNQIKRLGLDDTIVNSVNIANHGYMALNQYDGAIYISSQNTNSVVVVDSITNKLVYVNTLIAPTTKLTYNPDRKSIWVLQPSLNQLVEILVEIKNQVTTETIVTEAIVDNMYGTLHPSFKERDDMWLKTRDYFRRPRENFNTDNQIKYYWRWFSDNIPQFFMYDFSGEQLARTTTGSYSYIGTTPLTTIVLNKNSNKDVTKVSVPEYQQTIFDKIEYTLSYIDDELDISTDVEPLQLFIGFRSDNEGALRSLLQLYKKEDIFFTISGIQSEVYLQTLDVNGPDKRGMISLSQYSTDSFIDRGLKVGQHIVIYLKDNQNDRNQYISHNNGSIFKIREVYSSQIILDFFDIVNDIIDTESSVITDYPKSSETTYLDFSIKVRDKEIGRFFTYGQTEEEDIRFKIELGNVGKLIAPDDVFIFKQYDIEEGGIDWLYLNKKRKEMMMMKHLIYPYIGSYKSIINAINFFGYNDLQLNEYYRNIDPTALNFLKLFKVEIPDIFDNTVEGWTENDFIKHTMPNDNFEETNLFNLSYFITDKEGNNILNYTLDEIIIKLQGLKYWLKKNIIPLTHKILDITGNVYFTGGTQIQHRLHDVRIVNIYDNMTPITFKLNETYLMPVNSGSTVYNCVLDFYTIIPDLGADKTKTGLVVPPTPFNGKILVLPDYFTVKIRTYKTYKEWAPFNTYNLGDRVTYYGKLYESVTSSNKVNSPKEYEFVTPWVSGQIYDLTSIVEYNRDTYVFTKGATVSTVTPFADNFNWDKITKWKEIDWSPVQTISEFRNGDNLLPFNFTIDSNIDTFITIEVISNNGYGCVYNDKKNYEIRGLKDLTLPYQDIEPIVPFEPIILNTTESFIPAPDLRYNTPNVFIRGIVIPNLDPIYFGGTVISYSISPNLPSGLSFDEVTGRISGTPTSISSITTYTVIATNTGGSTPFEVVITVSEAPITLSYNTPNIFTRSVTNVNLTPTVSGTVTSYSISPVLPNGLLFNPSTGVISGIPTSISSIGSYTVTATNTGGSTLFVLQITVNDLAPILSYNTPNTFTRSVTIADLVPTISGGTVISYSISPALPNGLLFNPSTGVISGTPTVIRTLNTYTVTAANTGGSTSFGVVITVNDLAPILLFYISPNVFTTNVQIVDLTPSVSGGTVISYSISPALPSGLIFNTTTGVISGTPTAISAITTYTATATNTGGSTSFVLQITVNEPIIICPTCVERSGGVTIELTNSPWDLCNLNVSRYRDGTAIPRVTDQQEWATLTTGAWCSYQNDPANDVIYGKLYNWYAVAGIYDEASLNDESLRKKLAPTQSIYSDRFIPTNNQWTDLTNYLTDKQGEKMKETGTCHWQAPNNATNQSEFTGLPGGYREHSADGTFRDITNVGYWWSSTEKSVRGQEAFARGLDSGSEVISGSFDKRSGFSVRCKMK